MSTERVLLMAKIAVQQAQDDSIVLGIMVVCLIGAIVMGIDYLVRRWSWVPRKVQRGCFHEKF